MIGLLTMFARSPPVNPVRANPFAAVTPPQAGQAGQADAARLAAQRAFFQQALGQAQGQVQGATRSLPTATVQQAAPTPPAPAAQPAPRIPNADDPAPQRLLRPGSFLDIRV